jgi:hypothetical protein
MRAAATDGSAAVAVNATASVPKANDPARGGFEPPAKVVFLDVRAP